MKYAHVGEVINNIERSGLLVGNNAEWAKEAVYAAPTISVSDYVPDARIQQLIKQCEKQLSGLSKPLS